MLPDVSGMVHVRELVNIQKPEQKFAQYSTVIWLVSVLDPLSALAVDLMSDR